MSGATARGVAGLLKNNRKWAANVVKKRPEFFKTLSNQQSPEYLWIGCADSRVPANQIIGLDPGEVFVHRNIANVVCHTDFNALSVIEFAVNVLKVKHVIVCGHYSCGGVVAACGHTQLGLIDNWLRHIRDVRQKHQGALDAEFGPTADDDPVGSGLADRMAELNVQEQVRNVCYTSTIQAAWQRGQGVSVHGWIYGLADGMLKDLECTVNSQKELDRVYHTTRILRP